MLLAALAGLTLVLAGCQAPTPAGSTPASSGAPSASTAAFPRDVTVGGATVHLDAEPTKIVILGPTLTETAFAVGAGQQVVAVDKLSDYPSDAPRTKLDAFQPSAEAVSAYHPDLVLITNDQDKIVEALHKLKINAVLLPAPTNVAGAYEQFAQVGELTGHEQQAAKVTAEVKAKIAAATTKIHGTKASYFLELDPTLYTVTSTTFIGSLLAELGLTNIADNAPDAAGGYPQLSAEYVINADPDLIFLTDGQTPAQVRKRPGWDVIRAVKDANGIVTLSPDLASRWSPRMGDLAESVANAVSRVQ